MRRILLMGCCLGLALAGCDSGSQSAPFKTVPVNGSLLVDGQPASGVQVTFHAEGGVPSQHPTNPTVYSDDAGKFIASTFKEGDGLPEGKYRVTFFWGELNVFSMQYGGDDKLGGRYSKPESSEHVITVTAGSPVEMGEIRLTTK